jgi:hypothetical protein
MALQRTTARGGAPLTNFPESVGFHPEFHCDFARINRRMPDAKNHTIRIFIHVRLL